MGGVNQFNPCTNCGVGRRLHGVAQALLHSMVEYDKSHFQVRFGGAVGASQRQREHMIQLGRAFLVTEAKCSFPNFWS